MPLVVEWYSRCGRLLQVVDSGEADTPSNRRSLEKDARRQIRENRGMSDAPSDADYFRIGVI